MTGGEREGGREIENTIKGLKFGGRCSSPTSYIEGIQILTSDGFWNWILEWSVLSPALLLIGFEVEEKEGR